MFNKTRILMNVFIYISSILLLLTAPLTKAGKAEFEGGITATYLDIDDSRVRNESLLSIDLTAVIPIGPGNLTLYVEGSSTQKTNGVSSTIGEANGDAGSALDQNDKGRLQVSELHYSIPLNHHTVTAGLIDTTGFLDASEVANDENAQFLGTNFVNNPTIEFPDYTLGIAFQSKSNGSIPAINLVVTSSNGIADNSRKSYSQLTDVDESSKGIFAAVEGIWQVQNIALTVGTWTNTKDHTELNGSSTSESNYGIYAVADGMVGSGKWNIRLGMADEDVSETADFASLAIELPVASATVGAGIAHIGASRYAGAGKNDSTQAEVYADFKIAKNLHITPLIQYIKNSGFDNTSTSFDKNITVYGARMAYTF